MTCIEPGLVAPEDLVAYASGEEDARTAAHVAACPACAVEVAGYRGAARALRARLFRVDCPPTQSLGELSLGLLDAQEALAVRAHLALCPHCSDELAVLDAALRGDPLDELRPAP